MNWRDHIEANKNISAGKPVIRGTRLSVSFILELMGAGSDEAAILASYPQLTREDIRACLRCASEEMARVGNKSSIDDWILGSENDCEIYRG
ncbi:MAG: DUF433 domain-containing protein [Chloroflexota bacterium]|nr:DUF433 domain-containing protein [Chloroflexota bacterium]MDE2958573.1 DUF433 domain-containing protein [Chloroflexota bacterium]